jgi:hypothetical protein
LVIERFQDITGAGEESGQVPELFEPSAIGLVISRCSGPAHGVQEIASDNW